MITQTQRRYELANYPDNLDISEVRDAWIKKAFAPLMDFLDKDYPDEKAAIADRVMFMGHGGTDGTDFIYKNSLTRQFIIISTSGAVVKQEAGALL